MTDTEKDIENETERAISIIRGYGLSTKYKCQIEGTVYCNEDKKIPCKHRLDKETLETIVNALERNKAAIEECNVCIGGLSKLTGFRGEEAAFLQGQINAYKNILKILEEVS